MLGNIVKKAYHGITSFFRPRSAAAAVVLAASSAAPAAMITQEEPHMGSENTSLLATITNDDNQAVYDSFEDFSLQDAQDSAGNVYESLADALYQLNPSNQSNYASAADMMAEWKVVVLPPPSGEVSSGWSAGLAADSSIDITNIGGRPGRDYDQWLATQQNAGMDDLARAVVIPVEQMGDLTLRPTEESYPGVGVAHENGPAYTAAGKHYVVVPEPTTFALLGLGGLGFAARRRRDRAPVKGYES